MEIVEIRRNHVSLRDVRIVLVGRACDGVCLAETLSLLESLVGPHAGVKIGGLVLQEIHCHIKELETCSTTEEHYLVGVRNIEELFPVRPDFIHHFAPLLRAV